MRTKNTYIVDSVVIMDKDFDFIKLLEMFTKSQIDLSGFSIRDDKDNKNKIINLTWVLKNPWQLWMIHEQMKKYWNKLNLIKRKTT